MVVYFAVLYKTIEYVIMCLKDVYDICIHMVRKVVNPALGFVLKLISPDLGSISVCCPCSKRVDESHIKVPSLRITP